MSEETPSSYRHDQDREIAKLREEVAELKGPCTCSHDPEYAGGACAICYAETLDKLEKSVCQLGRYRELIDAVRSLKTARACDVVGICESLVAHHEVHITSSGGK